MRLPDRTGPIDHKIPSHSFTSPFIKGKRSFTLGPAFSFPPLAASRPPYSRMNIKFPSLFVNIFRFFPHKKYSNALLSRTELTTSGEDAGENIMAATSACGPANKIPEQYGDPIMLLNVTPLNVRLIRFSRHSCRMVGFHPRFSEALQNISDCT